MSSSSLLKVAKTRTVKPYISRAVLSGTFVSYNKLRNLGIFPNVFKPTEPNKFIRLGLHAPLIGVRVHHLGHPTDKPTVRYFLISFLVFPRSFQGLYNGPLDRRTKFDLFRYLIRRNFSQRNLSYRLSELFRPPKTLACFLSHFTAIFIPLETKETTISHTANETNRWVSCLFSRARDRYDVLNGP